MSSDAAGSPMSTAVSTRSRGVLLVLSAPSGAGKTTLVKALLARDPRLRFSVSYTTRKPRPGEVHGRDYSFVAAEEFRRMAAGGEFLEHAEVFGNFYGTSRARVAELRDQGYNVLLEIDVQGARQVRQNAPDCTTVFIMPPSVAELERRLRGRGTDAEEVIQRRLAGALSEMSHWAEFGYVVFNEQLDAALDALQAILAGGGSEFRSDRSAVARRAAEVAGP